MDSGDDTTESVEEVVRRLEGKSLRERVPPTALAGLVGFLVLLGAVGVSYNRLMYELRVRVPMNPDDCVLTPACKEEGACSFRPDTQRCVVNISMDCQRSLACTKHKRCVADNGVCVAKRDP